ncbi:MAG: hypothetical protein AAF549_00840 [Pseudomonadota bacterium]
MKLIEPDFNTSLKLWWAIKWRTFIATLIIILPLAFLLGYLGTLGGIITFIAYLALEIFIVRWLLVNGFKDHWIGLVEKEEE